MLSGRAFASVPNAPALLFFSVMVCTAQLAGINTTVSGADPLPSRRREILDAFFGLFLLGAVFSAVLYGIYMSHELNDPALQWNASCARPGVKLDGCAAADFSRERVCCVYLGGRVRGCPGYLG